MAGRDIVVIGASAGGVQSLREVVSGLSPNLGAAVFVAIHSSADNPGLLPQLLERAGPLPARHPRHGDPIRHGTIYVAPPDHHLMVADGHLQLTKTPRENGHRPAIDPTMRSAARLMRSASATEVPPNFMTTVGAASGTTSETSLGSRWE